MGRFAKRFPLKVTVTIAVGLLVALIAIFGFVLPYVMDDDENQYVTESDLKSAVDIDNLSTIDYVYHGIAEKHSTFLWQDRSCRGEGVPGGHGSRRERPGAPGARGV